MSTCVRIIARAIRLRVRRVGGQGVLPRRECADLVSGDGFLRQQGGRELGESFAVASEQVTSAGLGPGQERGDFLVDQPLGALGVAAG